MLIKRHKTKVIKIGNLSIGGNNPVAIQSMTKTKTSKVESTILQIRELEKAGCEIVRLAVKDSDDALAIRTIKQKTKIPLVCDIHFDWRLGLEAIENGADKIRLNPGNISQKKQIRQIAVAAKQHHIPIRVGVNSGSLSSRRSGVSSFRSQADKMVDSALSYVQTLEECGFYNIIISLKASDIFNTLEAYRKIAKLCNYPLHLGVTATGSPYKGAIKSSIALGALLLEGIGDTIRISLTDKPVNEIIAAKIILESLGLRSFGPEVISCPTCGRCEVDLVKIVGELENRLSALDPRLSPKPIKVAVMGCVVNGPGEASEADIGVAFGKKGALLFKNGKPEKKISYNRCVNLLLREINSLYGNKKPEHKNRGRYD